MLTATVPVAVNRYSAHGLIEGDGIVFDLDLQANERAARLVLFAFDGAGNATAYQAIGRMVPEVGWVFSTDLPGVVDTDGTHLLLSIGFGDPSASWQAWVTLTFTQDYEA